MFKKNFFIVIGIIFLFGFLLKPAVSYAEEPTGCKCILTVETNTGCKGDKDKKVTGSRVYAVLKSGLYTVTVKELAAKIPLDFCREQMRNPDFILNKDFASGVSFKGDKCADGKLDNTANGYSIACEVVELGQELPDSGGTYISLKNPIGSTNLDYQGTVEFDEILGTIVRYVMGFIGGLTLLVFMAGGFYWLISGGNAEKIKKGTDAMLWAVVGLFIIFGAYAILSLVIKGVTGGSEGSSIKEIEVEGDPPRLN